MIPPSSTSRDFLLDLYRSVWTSVEAHDCQPSDIEGKLPPELCGTLYTNGPGSTGIGNDHNRHFFDGDALVSAFSLHNGGVTFRSRYVLTPERVAEQQAGCRLYPRLGTQLSEGRLANARMLLHNHFPPNVSVAPYGKKLLALGDAGTPIRLDPETLETEGEETFHGLLNGLRMFCGHLHTDPVTHESFGFITRYVELRSCLEILQLDPAGEARQVAVIPVEHWYVVHDFALTPHYFVFVCAPLLLNSRKLMTGWSLGRMPFAGCLDWQPKLGMRVYLVPRQGGKTRMYTLPARFTLHLANAFEIQDEVCFDMPAYPNGWLFKTFQEVMQGREQLHDVVRSTLLRVHLLPEGAHWVEWLGAHNLEFPRIHEDYRGRAHRYLYGCAAPEKLVKVDTQTHTVKTWSGPPDALTGEPVFVPRPGATQEDDGWILSVNYASDSDRSFLAVLDAKNFECQALVWLPFALSFRLHSLFVKDVLLSSQGGGNTRMQAHTQAYAHAQA